MMVHLPSYHRPGVPAEGAHRWSPCGRSSLHYQVRSLWHAHRSLLLAARPLELGAAAQRRRKTMSGIMDLLSPLLHGEGLDALSSFVGESSSGTRRALEAASAGSIGALAGRASTEQGS